MKKERTPEQKMAAFLDLVRDDETKPTAAGSEAAAKPKAEADLDRQLLEAGFDLEQVNAHIEADRQEALRELATIETAETAPATPPAKVIPLRRRRSVVLWLMPIAAAFAGLFAIEGAEVLAWLSDTGPVLVGAGPDAKADFEHALSLRDLAHADCEAGRFADCIAKIDRAIALHPPFAKDPSLEKLRAQANESLSAASTEGGTRE